MWDIGSQTMSDTVDRLFKNKPARSVISCNQIWSALFPDKARYMSYHRFAASGVSKEELNKVKIRIQLEISNNKEQYKKDMES